MASGHVNRINRPNTWLHRPSLRREDFSCQPGAVHTWHAERTSMAMPEPTRMTPTRTPDLSLGKAPGTSRSEALSKLFPNGELPSARRVSGIAAESLSCRSCSRIPDARMAAPGI
jgi:hypothetical protein